MANLNDFDEDEERELRILKWHLELVLDLCSEISSGEPKWRT